jgi:hypothetical protein
MLKNIKEVQKNYENEFTDDFMNFSDNYINDLFSEIADSRVNIYNSDLLKWVGENGNSWYVEQAQKEFGVADDFYRGLMQGQYYQYMEELDKCVDDLIMYYGLEYLKDLKGEELDEELIDLVIENIELNNDIEELVKQVKKKDPKLAKKLSNDLIDKR